MPRAKDVKQKIYVVIGGWDYEGNDDPANLCSSVELAQAAADEASPQYGGKNISILEYELDGKFVRKIPIERKHKSRRTN